MHCDRQESDRPLYGQLCESPDFPGYFPRQFQISFSIDLRNVSALMPTNDLGRFDSLVPFLKHFLVRGVTLRGTKWPKIDAFTMTDIVEVGW